MDLSIIIVNWNTRDLLIDCLNSIHIDLDVSPTLQTEIFVIDNSSSDDSVSVFKTQFPWVILIENHQNVGFAKANNQGINLSSGKFILLLNSDAYLQPNTLNFMIDAFQKNNDIGAIGGKIFNPDGTFQASYASFPTIASEVINLIGLAKYVIGPYAPSPSPIKSEKAFPVDWVSGAAIMFRRNVIDDIGLLDEGYFLYSEETDLCWRMWKHGWQVWYLPDIHITHLGGASSKKSPVVNYSRLYLSKLRFFSKNYGNYYREFFRVILVIITIFRLFIWQFQIIIPTAQLKQVYKSKFQQEIYLLLTLLKIIPENSF